MYTNVGISFQPLQLVTSAEQEETLHHKNQNFLEILFFFSFWQQVAKYLSCIPAFETRVGTTEAQTQFS